MTDRTVVYRIQADVAQAKAQIAALGASVKKSADDMTAATKEGAKFRQGLDTLGGAAGKVGLVAAAGLGAAVIKAADFDQAMSNIQAATHESAAAMESLREAALKAGADTAFSATEAAAGIENLAKAGISTEDILGGALAGALDLAAAGGMEVADAAEAAAGAMAQFNLEGSEATHVADLLAAGAGKAQGDVSDMVMALKQAGTVSAQTGLSIEETTGSLAAMAEQSLLGSDAGTSFKTMLAALTPNSSKAAKAMEQYNIHAFDAQGNFVGMTELAGQLQSGLGGLTDEQRLMTMETIFGSDAVRAASIIYDNGASGIQGWIDKTNDAGYASETAAIKLDNLKGDLEALGGSFETALIGTGDGSEGALRSLTQGLTGAVNAYNGLGDGAKNGVGVALTATAALGGGLFVFSKVVQAVSSTRDAMDNLGISAESTKGKMALLGKASLGLAGMAAAGAALEALRESLEESLPGMSELTGQILAISEGKVSSLGSEFDSLASSIDRMDPGYIMRSSDAILGLLSLGTLDGKEIDGARQEIEALDEALTNLASSGGTDVATKAFDDLAEAQGLTAAEQKELLGLMPGYKEALASNANQTALTAEETTDLGVAMTKAAAKTEAQEKALEDARDAAHETAGGFVNLGDSLNDASVSLGDWITQMAEQADALNNFTKNAEVAADRGLRKGLIAALKEAGPEGALRMKQLANATQGELDKANAAWDKGQKAISRYVDATARVPGKVSTLIEVRDELAMSKLYELQRFKIGDKTITIHTVRTGGDGDFVSGGIRKATGGPVFGPGTSTSDSIPALLSNGEHVWTAEEVANAGGHAAVEGLRAAFRFADGGPVRLAGGGSADKAREKREEARRRAEERRDREEERRQRRLDKQRTKALLSSDLGDEAEQSALEVADARRRLRSAKKADRPKGEILDARLALKEERAEQRDLQKREAEDRARAAEEAEEERQRIAQEAEDERIRIAEEAAERQREIDDAIFDGQTRAWDQATDAAQANVDAAKAMVDSVQANMDRIGSAATSAFSGSWFTGGQDQQHGLWTGANIGPAGDWKSKAMTDISGLQDRNALISQLSGLGLSGAALEDLLGNQSNAGISAMISAGEIDDFAALFAQRQSLMETVGASAGQAGYGADMSSATSVLAQANTTVAALTAAIKAARPITILQQTTEAAAAAELARLLSVTGGF